MIRALASLLPPTGNGMTTRTILPGNACAKTLHTGARNAAAMTMVQSLERMYTGYATPWRRSTLDTAISTTITATSAADARRQPAKPFVVFRRQRAGTPAASGAENLRAVGAAGIRALRQSTDHGLARRRAAGPALGIGAGVAVSRGADYRETGPYRIGIDWPAVQTDIREVSERGSARE